MANRFTDTTKWKRPWFRALSLHGKMVWMYLCDECDHAGIWIADFEVASLQLGFKIDHGKLKEWLGTKLVQVEHDRYFIPSFFDYQYGNAKEGFKAKQSALKSLKSFGLVEESSDSLRDLTNSYLSVPQQSPDCLSIGTIISTGKGNTGSTEGTEPLATDSDRETVYKKYPNKVGKSDGLAKLKKLCPTKSHLADFESAMLAYVADCKKADRFLKQFDTFVNSPWKDWLDPEARSATGAGASVYDWADITGQKVAK